MYYNQPFKFDPYTGKPFTEIPQPIQFVNTELVSMTDEQIQRVISAIRYYLSSLPCDNKMENHKKKSHGFHELFTLDNLTVRPKTNGYFYNQDTILINRCTHFNLDHKYVVVKQLDGFMQCPICNRRWTKESANMELSMLNTIISSNFKIELTSIKNKAYTEFSARKRLDRLVYRDKYTNRLICEQIENICMRDFQYLNSIKQVRYLNFITGKTKTIIERI